MQALAVIPARYASSRFPGKPLTLLQGRPMFWHVWQRVRQCPEISQTVVATDDLRILEKAQELGVPALMTSPNHPSGTDRVLEAAQTLKTCAESIIVNVQGDEPALHPQMLSELLSPFVHPEIQISTLGATISPEEARDPNRVKIIRATDGRALYFSRSPIPFAREGQAAYLGHIGLYAFRRTALERFSQLGESPLERVEKLEQLRLLEANIPIHVALTAHHSFGVDRPEDVPKACALLQATENKEVF